MFNISQYLERFKNFGQSEKLFKELIIELVKEIVGVELKPTEVLVKKGEITFKVSPAIKNAIYIKKEQILKKIKEKNPTIVNEIR